MYRYATLNALLIVSLATSCHRAESAKQGLSDARKADIAAIERSADVIENEVQKIPCIGQIMHWERKYSFSRKDHNIIDFVYKEAGKYEFRSRREILEVASGFQIDDRPYRTVYGSYDIKKSSLMIDYCGLNAPVADELRS